MGAKGYDRHRDALPTGNADGGGGGDGGSGGDPVAEMMRAELPPQRNVTAVLYVGDATTFDPARDGGDIVLWPSKAGGGGERRVHARPGNAVVFLSGVIDHQVEP